VLKIDEQILKCNRVLCRHIDNIGRETRGEISQDILAQLRHFIEHIMLKIYANGNDIEDSQENIKKAIKYTKNESSLLFFSRFHRSLQVSVSHRTLSEENSERLMLKYYTYLLKIKNYLHDNYGLDVLENLGQFPIEMDDSLKEYYEKIAEKIDRYKTPIKNEFRFDRFYIQGIKPFFWGKKIYYEVAFIPGNDKASKTDRIIAFTDIEITDYYAVKFAMIDESIELFGKKMPIRIIVDWEVSIRPCEFSNFIKLINNDGFIPSTPEQQNINNYLTETGLSLSEVVMFSDEGYQNVYDIIVPKTKAKHFFDILNDCRSLIKDGSPGSNVIRYLLHHMRNRILKSQYQDHWKRNNQENRREYVGGNFKLSNLYLAYECIPFDTMPFCSALKNHVPSLSCLLSSLDAKGREHEILAWIVKNNTEQKGMLFTPLNISTENGKYLLGDFEDVGALVAKYNKRLYTNERQQARKLVIKNDYIFIESYETDTISIIKQLKNLSEKGVNNYINTVTHWLQTTDYHIDAEEKKTALINMFANSHVALIYGSAGTGKTTLINYISHFFSSYSRLYLAHTNPAVNNLKRKVTASMNCEFMTITKFNNKTANIKRDFDILIIDECSTISNSSMKELLELAKFKLLVLVGDTYQIGAIEFGNWFDAVRSFLPTSAVCELTNTYRSESRQLLDLWNNVRKMENEVYDRLQAGEISATPDASIFNPAAENEIILCLNYGGLYGINNINHFMQENNSGKEIWRGIQRYKVGDPILFNDSSEQFFRVNKEQLPIIHNNMKGKIVDFCVQDAGKTNERIQFDIEIDRPLINFNSKDLNFEIINNSASVNSVIRFCVYKNKSTDEDDDVSQAIVPFQVAYAVSIHKAQGLEYDSVKVVITDEVDELITHSIFYTAITRARKSLKIYWTHSVEKKVLERIKPKNNHQDVSLLKNEIYN
jgi:hypothetical protein